MKKQNISNILIRCEFIDLIDRLERINYDYVDLNELNNFIYYDSKNEDTYKIANVINDREKYIFQYKKTKDNSYELINIPNAIFNPKTEYDFNLDLINKTFKKTDEYNDIELHTIININTLESIEQIELEVNKKNKSLLRKIFGC
jgi:hypothetical protein